MEEGKPGPVPEEIIEKEDSEVTIPDRNAETAWNILNAHDDPDIHELTDIYQKHHEHTAVNGVEVKVKSDSISVLYGAELLVGNPDSAVDFYINTMDRIKDLPEAEKPDVIVLSGFLQGYFKHLDKNKRTSLPPELASMNQQYRYAKELLDKATDVGVPVIYSMGDDDHRINVEHNLEHLRRLEGYAAGHEEGRSDVLNYKKVNDLKGHEAWVPLLEFQSEICYPYRLNAGRRLRTADEMYAVFGDEYGEEARVEELILLYEQKEKRRTMREEGKQYQLRGVARGMLDVEAFKATDPEKTYKKGDIIITDDLDLTLTTLSSSYTDQYRHVEGASSQPLYVTHLPRSLKRYNDLHSKGKKAPNGIRTFNQIEEVGVFAGESLVASTGGLIRPENYMKRKGIYSDIPGDKSRRVLQRGRISSPSMAQHERFDDGRHELTVFNEALMEKMDSIERTAVVMYCDWQTGSDSARPELQVKLMDYVRTRVLGEMAVQIMVAGDMLHGRNYSHFASEAQAVGLISMDAQEEFVKRLLRTDLENYTPDEMRGIRGVSIEPGNHEWNSGLYKWHGYSFTGGIESEFRTAYRAIGGLSAEETDERIDKHDKIITKTGESFQTYSSIVYLGAYGVHSSHFMMDRGAGGGGGGLPVYQANAHSLGAGSNAESIDFNMAGHFHHGSYHLAGDKLNVIAPALAGLTSFEFRRGLRATSGALILEIGGGKPPTINLLTERALKNHVIKEGPYSDKELEKEGYTTDSDFDPGKHTTMTSRHAPHNALQKRIRREMDDASNRVNSTAHLR